MKKQVFVFVLCLLSLSMFGCASSQPVVYLNNEAIPGRTYTLSSTAAPISATALFYCLKPVRDVDDTTFQTIYLPLNENLSLSAADAENLFIRVSITNPEKRTYSLSYYSRVKQNDGREYGQNVHVGRSNLPQRTFTVRIPRPAVSGEVSFYVFLQNEKGNELLRIGTFRYQIPSTFPSSR